MTIAFLDILGIGETIWNLLFDIFTRGPLYIVHGLGDAITYLSGQKVVVIIFGSHGHFLNLPPQFITFLVISIALIVLFSGCVILHAMVNQGIGSAMAGLANRILMILLLLVLVPLFFWIINFTVISIIKIIMPQLIDGRKLADMVGRLGFTNNIKHYDNWHYDVGYPDWNHYNLFLSTFGSFFCLIIFFLMGISLIKRLFDLFLLYVTSPVIFATAASSIKWQKVSIWKDLVIGRFISTLGIVLTLTLFMNLEPLMLNAANQVSDSWVGQVAFKLLFIAGGAMASYNAQILFSSLVGTTVGIADGIGMLFSMKAATSTIKVATLGMVGMGKGLLIGKNKVLNNNETTKTLTTSVLGALKGGTIAKTTSAVIKTTIGSVLTATGFMIGTKHCIQKHGWKKETRAFGKQTVKPIVNLGKVIKEKTTKSYNTGLDKHSVSKYDKPSKNLNQQLKNKDGKDKKPTWIK